MQMTADYARGCELNKRRLADSNISHLISCYFSHTEKKTQKKKLLIFGLKKQQIYQNRWANDWLRE